MLPATIVSIKQAFKEIKHFCIDTWEGDYRPAARQALKQILESRMHNSVDEYLQRLHTQDLPDRRNGSYPRHLLTELGDLQLCIPRTRTFSPIALLHRFARRALQVDRMILMAFVLGLSTRKVSRVAKQLDAAVEAYHQRPLSDRYEVLILDGVVIKRTVLVALGIRSNGKKEIIDFQQAFSESQSAWEGFLNHLYQRGLSGTGLKLFVRQWQRIYPKATACLVKDLPELLTFLTLHLPLKTTELRTTNAIERRFREVRRRTRPMGTFSDHTSVDRILFAVFTDLNQKEGVATPFLLTQTS